MDPIDQKLEQQAVRAIARYRALYVANVFVLARVARARMEQDSITLGALQPDIHRIKVEMDNLRRELMRLRSMMMRRRLARAGHTPTNFGPAPDYLPEEL